MLVDCPSRKILVNLTLIYMSVIVMSGKRVVLTVTSVGRVSYVNLSSLLLIVLSLTRLRTITR